MLECALEPALLHCPKQKGQRFIQPLTSFSINAAALTKTTSSQHAYSPLLVFCGVDPSTSPCLQLYSTITAKLLLKFSTVSLVVLRLSALYMYFRNYFHLEIFPTIHSSLGKVSLPLARFFKKRELELWRVLHKARVGARVNQFRFFRACKQIITQRDNIR